MFKPQMIPPMTEATRSRPDQPKTAVVVGGGLAGAAAATILAERGVSVVLLEREPVLGGRVSGWTDRLDDGEPFEMERGFHAFFRQYYNLRGLLRRFDPALQRLTPLTDYPILGPGGAIETFRGLSRLPIVNVAQLVWRTSYLKIVDLWRADVRQATAMLTYDRNHTYGRFDRQTASAYLDSLRFPPQARRMLFDVFSHSFFNPEAEMSAGELLMMFHFYFIGNPEGLIFDVLNESFSDALWRPWQRYLERYQVAIHTRTEVDGLERTNGDGWRVNIKPGGNIAGDAVVLAVNVPALREIVGRSVGLNDEPWQAGVRDLALTYPFTVWRIWLDRNVRPDRAPFVGTAGLGLIDNISVYELFEGESRRHFLRTGGSVLELHAYAVPPQLDETAIRTELLNRLHELYPETREAKIVEERFMLRQDCPAFAPGSDYTRPTVETPFPGLALCGDFVRLPLPSALMEKAATSGIMAANHLLNRWHVRGEEIWSVPHQGVLSSLGPKLFPVTTG